MQRDAHIGVRSSLHSSAGSRARRLPLGSSPESPETTPTRRPDLNHPDLIDLLLAEGADLGA